MPQVPSQEDIRPERLFDMAAQAHQRLDTHEVQIRETKSFFQLLKDELAAQGQVQQQLLHEALRRETREKVLAEVAQQQAGFWKAAIPVIVTLLLALIGAIVWLVSRLPGAQP